MDAKKWIRFIRIAPGYLWRDYRKWRDERTAQKALQRKEEIRANRQRLGLDPSPHSTTTTPRPAEALVQMRLVKKYLADIDTLRDDFAKHKLGPVLIDNMERILAGGLKALERARQLDDSAILLEDTKEHGTLSYSQDILAGMLLFEESNAYFDATYIIKDFYEIYAYSFWNNNVKRPRFEREQEAMRRDNYLRALNAIERAVTFDPYNPLYLRRKISLLDLLGDKQKARAVLDHALKLHPEDLDLHKLRDGI